MKKRTIVFLAVIIALLFSCSSSRITSSWKAENIPAGKYRKIMVMALAKGSDHALQQQMETHMVDDLRAQGVDAVSAFQQYGPKAFDNMEEKNAVDKIRTGGYDAVVTIVLLDKAKENYYVPGATHIRPVPVPAHYRRFWGYYSYQYVHVYTPGYYVTNTSYFWESNMYDLENNNLVYTAQTRSFDPSSTESLAHEYGKLIMKDMVKNGIFPGS